MKTFFVDITLKIDSETITSLEALHETIDNLLDNFLDRELFDSEVKLHHFNIEESKHGFRVQDSDGNWCEPSDGFAAMVKRDEEILAKMREKNDG